MGKNSKSSGLNLNPLAPAQSKRAFAFSGKTRNSIEILSISAPFFSLLFCIIFEPFPETSKKRSRVGPQSHKNTPKWTPGAPKRSPRISKLRPKVPLSQKNLQMPSKGGTMEPQVLQWNPKTAQSTRKTRKRFPKCEKTRICAASAEKHTSTHKP